MQIIYPHKHICRIYSWFPPEETKSEFVTACERLVAFWDGFGKMHHKEKQALLKISRSTYYRTRKFLEARELKSKRPIHVRKSKFSDETRNLVWKLRKEHPTYGKTKIKVLFDRENTGVQISESTIGRMLKKMNFPKSNTAPRRKRKRDFSKTHAKPFQFKSYDQMSVGEKVQIDHMSVKGVKHFAAIDRISKYLYSNVYNKAGSKTAAKFLREFVKVAPFKIRSIQVDGGSEFMNEFEQTCKELGIPLEVLPPATPKYNGCVERSNKTLREEFYAFCTEDSLMGKRRELMQYLKGYNTIRPHAGINNMTPMEYLEKTGSFKQLE